MAVQSGTTQQSQAQQTQQETLNVGTQQAQQTSTESSMWSFTGAGLPDLVSTKAGGADVRTISATIAAILAKEKPQPGFVVDTVVIDNTAEPGWRYGAVIVTLKQTEQNIVAFHSLVLESTETHALEAEVREVGAIVYHVDHVPSDALDTAYTKRILKAVSDANPNASLLDASGLVVTKKIDCAQEDQVRPILHNAARACMTAIVESNPDFMDVNLGLRTDNTYQTVSLTVTDTHAINIVDEPIRQDVLITLTSRQKQDQQQGQQQNQPRSINNIGAAEAVIGSVGGFFDCVITPPNTNVAYGYGQNPLDRTRCMIKRFTITNLIQPKLATLASTLMLANQAVVLTDQSVSDSVYFQRMKQHRLAEGTKSKDKGVDPTDVGILNLIANIAPLGSPPGSIPTAPAPYDLKSNTVQVSDFAAYMNQVFFPDISLAIDVPRAGPSSWVLDVFTAAANDNPQALAEIVRAADKLTNGLFSQFFFQGKQQQVVTKNMVFSEVNNTVHNGFFMKQVGDVVVKRDIREVDYLYVLNRFGQMDKTALDWAMTFLVDRMNPYQRMARRKEIIEACIGGKVTITGYSERHTFSALFVNALFSSCLQANLKPNFQYNNPLAGANSGLVTPSFASSGLIGGQLLSAGFNTGGSNSNAGGAFLNPTQGRWG